MCMTLFFLYSIIDSQGSSVIVIHTSIEYVTTTSSLLIALPLWLTTAIEHSASSIVSHERSEASSTKHSGTLEIVTHGMACTKMFSTLTTVQSTTHSSCIDAAVQATSKGFATCKAKFSTTNAFVFIYV